MQSITGSVEQDADSSMAVFRCLGSYSACDCSNLELFNLMTVNFMCVPINATIQLLSDANNTETELFIVFFLLSTRLETFVNGS